MSDINTEARATRARHEMIGLAAMHGLLADSNEEASVLAIDAILADFARLAGLLGYVKADGTRTAYGVRRAGVVYPNVFGSAQQAVEWSLGFTDNGVGCEIVRRHVSAWEVVVDASE